MKKLFSVGLLTVLIAVSFFGCSGESDKESATTVFSDTSTVLFSETGAD